MRPLGLALVLLVCAAPLPARAGGAERAPDSREAQARSYFTIGLNHFKLGEYEKAIEAFRAGYRLRPQPLFLFNIAQAARKSGRVELAIEHYERYLQHEPLRSAPQRAEAEQHLARLRRLQAAPPAAAAPSSPASLAPPVRTVAAPVRTVAAPARTVAPPTVGPAPTVAPVVSPGPGAPTVAATATVTASRPARVPTWKRGWVWGTVAGMVVAGVGAGVGAWLGTRARSTPHNSLGWVDF